MSGAERSLVCWASIAVLTAMFTHAARTGGQEADVPLSRYKREAQCHAKFQRIPGHTACLPGRSSSVTEADKRTILDTHNNFRASVSPTASDMLKLRWDDELTMLAQKWADNCETAHDENEKRSIPGRLAVGQNLAWGHASWTEAINDWHGEVAAFTYNDQSMNTKLSQIGHYTQVVWAKTSLIGCGMQTCENRNLFVCNYAEPGNLRGNLHKPYRSGAPCADCPGHCSGGTLCDCQLTCYNRGTLQLDTCTCSCKVTPDLYQPPNCALNCSGQDQTGLCEQNNDCSMISVYCPHKCDVCPTAGVGYTGSGASGMTGHPRLLACLALLLLQLKCWRIL